MKPTYSPTFSPWFRGTEIVPEAGWFVLPENEIVRPTDHATNGVRWYPPATANDMIRDYIARYIGVVAYSRKITDHPGLYRRMCDYAKESVKNESANPANFVVTCDNPALSDAVTNVAVTNGICWEQNSSRSTTRSDPHSLFVIRAPEKSNMAYILGISRGAIGDNSWDLPRYDAATQFGEIVRLLSTPFAPPAPKSPVIHGYTMEYTRGEKVVRFGCAVIALDMLIAVSSTYKIGTPSNNRYITSITLDSGKTLTREQIAEIRAYTKHVNGVTT